jgi:ubiquinone/menaquinone biosynthesis C-methylase UbiE
VVDIGLGTGGTTKAILARCPEACVTGIDNESSMIAIALDGLSLHLDTRSVSICESDALDALECLPAESVDVVASALTFHNWPDSYRAQVEHEVLRILAPGGLLVNNDKYAADDPKEYSREIANSILCFDVLNSMGLYELRGALIEHEIEDQAPERIMWTGAALKRLEAIGFKRVSLLWRRGQHAAVAAFKPGEFRQATP